MLGDRGPSRMAAGSNCSATTSAPRPQRPGSISSPAHALVPPAAPGHRAEHGGASTGTAAPAEVNQPCLTRTLTGKAFPLLRDLFASTDIPLSHRANHRLQPRSVPTSAACHCSCAGSFLRRPVPSPGWSLGCSHGTLAVLCHSGCSWPCTGFFLLPSNGHFCSGVF